MFQVVDIDAHVSIGVVTVLGLKERKNDGTSELAAAER